MGVGSAKEQAKSTWEGTSLETWFNCALSGSMCAGPAALQIPLSDKLETSIAGPLRYKRYNEMVGQCCPSKAAKTAALPTHWLLAKLSTAPRRPRACKMCQGSAACRH